MPMRTPQQHYPPVIPNEGPVIPDRPEPVIPPAPIIVQQPGTGGPPVIPMTGMGYPMPQPQQYQTPMPSASGPFIPPDSGVQVQSLKYLK